MENWSASLDFPSIARAHGTPAYVFSPARLLELFGEYAALVGSPVRVAYPVKANPSLAVLRTLAVAGAGADCASSAEIEVALLAGFPGESIFYNTPAIELTSVRTVLSAGGAVVANSVASLHAISGVAKDTSPSGKVFVRWNPDTTADDSAQFTAHGSSDSQFGMTDDSLVEATCTNGVPVTGVHTHIGSRQTDLSRIADMIIRLHRIVDRANGSGARITDVNLGGGLACATSRTEDVPSVADLAAAVGPLLRPDLTYYVEPGNSLVGDCIGVLTSLVDVRRAAARTLAIADIGSDQLLKVSVLGKPHDILDAEHRPLPREGKDTLFGPLNFVGDVLLPTTSLDGVTAGDVLFVQHCGAYCQALGNHFNGRLAPSMLMVLPDGDLRQCTTSEPSWLGSARTTHLWQTDAPSYPEPVVHPADDLDGGQLWCSVRRLSDNTFEFELSGAGGSPSAFAACEAAVAATLTVLDARISAARVSKIALDLRTARSETAAARVLVAAGPVGSGTALFQVSSAEWFDATGEASWDLH